MSEEIERNQRAGEGAAQKQPVATTESPFSRGLQVLQAAALGWCAGALSVPSWHYALPPLLAIAVWFGDPARARYPSVMLVAFGLSVGRALWLPVAGGAATGSGLRELTLLAVVALTGYGATRRPRTFFAGPAIRGWMGRVLLLGLAVAVSVQFTGLWRLGSRLGLGTPEDDVMFRVVSVALLAVGGVAFGRLFSRSSELHVALGLGASSALSFAALAVVGGISTPRGFRALCERFGADASLAGTATVDAAVAGSIGVLPLLALGASIHLARDRGALAAVLLGLSLGPLLALEILPTRIESIAQAMTLPGSAALPKYGAMACGILLVPMGWAARAPRVAAASGILLALLGALVPVRFVPILQPWNRFPVQPEAIFETAAGQFTIQASRAGRMQVLLDQRPLLPNLDQAGLDRVAILESHASATESGGGHADAPLGTPGDRTAADALVIGLATPERAAVLAELGITEFGRLTCFPEVAPLIEQRLFEAARLAIDDIPAGYQAWLDGSRFEPVFVFTPGAQPAMNWGLGHHQAGGESHFERPLWADPDRPLLGQAGARIEFASDGLRAFCARQHPVDFNEERGARVSRGDAALRAPSVIDWLRLRPGERPREALRWILRRMSPPPGRETFHRGFVEFARIQRVGSPFESADERVILNERALSLWREFAIAQTELLRHERSMLEGAADALRAQGEIEWMTRFLAPIAAAHGPWPELDEALAWARAQQAPAGRLAIMGVMSKLTMLRPEAEGATIGVISAMEVRKVDPGDGAPLIFTGLTVRGTDLATGEPREVQVWYPGGVVDEDTGSFTADAPKRHQTRIGRGAVVFHRHSDNMGGGLAGEVLVGGAAGLLNTFQTSDKHTLVLGKGQDRPSGGNISAEELRSRFRALSGFPPNPPR